MIKHLDETNPVYDAAILLSLVKRWQGRTIIEFTVLQHLLVCGRLAAQAELSPIEQLGCYLHDIEEGVIGVDIPRAWKTGQQRELERQVRADVYRQLHLPYPDEDQQETIKLIDDFEALAESEILLSPLKRIEVVAMHEGDTPDHDDVLAASQVVWEVARMTQNEAVDAYVSAVNELLDHRSVKVLRERLG